jgi:hypothetical protein
VQGLHANECFAPVVQLVVRERQRVYLVFDHNRMWLTLGTVGIELFFEQLVDCFIDVERRAFRTFDFQPHIQPKTSRALLKQLDLAAAHLERRFLPWLVRHRALSPIIVVRHRSLL